MSANTSIVTADVNGDGHLDIVTDTGAVLLGNGDGTFINGEGPIYAGGGAPVIADFNGDGNQDLLFLTYPLSLLLGNGDGTFQSTVGVAGTGPQAFGGFADFSQNGHLGMVGSGGAFWQVPAGLYPASLSYSPQNVGTSSPPQTATLYNAGSTPLNLTKIGIVGKNAQDFTQTNNCPTSIPVAGSCQIQVIFTPTAGGPRQAKIQVTYAGFGSPQVTALSGTGIGNTSVTLTPSNLTFGKQLLNTSSAAQTATLTNNGANNVTINNIATSGPFSQTNNCPNTLLPGKSCKIQVTFTPTQNGVANGTLKVTDSAPNSPQTTSLSGTGTSVKFSPIGINFGDQKVGTKSNPVPITFTNQGTVVLNISQIGFGGADPEDFSQTNNCPSSLPAGGNCTIQVTFSPTKKGARSAELEVSDDAQPSPQQAAVGGTGT